LKKKTKTKQNKNLILKIPVAQKQVTMATSPWRTAIPTSPQKWLPESRTIAFNGNVYTQWRGLTYITGEPKSLLRGWFHALALVLALSVSAHTVTLPSTSASPSSNLRSLYICTTFLLLFSSSLFHCIPWKTLAQQNAIKRIDHAMVFLYGGAMVTAPGFVLASNIVTPSIAKAGLMLLACTWIVAIVGIVYSLCKPRMYDRVEWQAFYMLTLVAAIPLMCTPWLYLGLPGEEFAIMLLHFALCAAGGWIYAHEQCNWWPDVAGYHELFHVCSLCDMALMYYLTDTIAQRIDHSFV